MTTQQAISILRQHNAWRRGDDTIEMQEPKEIGEAIDVAVRFIEISQYKDDCCGVDTVESK